MAVSSDPCLDRIFKTRAALLAKYKQQGRPLSEFWKEAHRLMFEEIARWSNVLKEGGKEIQVRDAERNPGFLRYGIYSVGRKVEIDQEPCWEHWYLQPCLECKENGVSI